MTCQEADTVVELQDVEDKKNGESDQESQRGDRSQITADNPNIIKCVMLLQV